MNPCHLMAQALTESAFAPCDQVLQVRWMAALARPSTPHGQAVDGDLADLAPPVRLAWAG